MKAVLVFLLAATLAACNSSVQRPDSPNESFAMAAVAVEQSYQLLEAAVRNPQVDLSRARAQEIHDRIRRAEEIVRGARRAYRAGENSAPDDVLSRVRAILLEADRMMRSDTSATDAAWRYAA